MKEYKYFWCTLDCKLDEKSELNRNIGSFNNMIDMFLRTIATVELDVNKSKALQYTLFIYLWARINSRSNRLFKCCEEACCFLSLYTCIVLNMFTFQHLVNYMLFRYNKWLSERVFFVAHVYGPVHFSVLSRKVRSFFSCSYVFNLLKNVTIAIGARIGYVQLR